MRANGWAITGLVLLGLALGASAVGKCANCGLGEGEDACHCGEVVVKAAKVPKPAYYASPDAINHALKYKQPYASGSAPVTYAVAPAAYAASGYAHPGYAAAAAAAPAGYGGGYAQTSCRSRAPQPSNALLAPQTGYAGDGGKTYQELQNLLYLRPGTPVAPKFEPLGDLCSSSKSKPYPGNPYGKTKSGNNIVGVVPAYPGKTGCRCPPPAPPKVYPSPPQALYPSAPASYPVAYAPSATAYSAPAAYAPYASPAAYAAPAPAPYSPAPGPVYNPAPAPYSPAAAKSYLPRQYAPAYSAPTVYSAAAAPTVYAAPSAKVPCAKANAAPGPQYVSEDDEGLSYAEQEQLYKNQPTIPADPVSISLAYKNLLHTPSARKFVPEDRLAFGHRQQPADGQVHKEIANVPEEKLLTVDRPIVELKAPCKCASYGGSGGYTNGYGEEDGYPDLEAIEREKYEHDVQEAGSHGIVSYSDLGYAPVSPSKNQFIPKTDDSPAYSAGHHQYGAPQSNVPCGPLGPTIPGYRPGGLLVENKHASQSSCGCHKSSYGLENRGLDSNESEEYSGEELGSGCGCSKGGIIERIRSNCKSCNKHHGGY